MSFCSMGAHLTFEVVVCASLVDAAAELISISLLKTLRIHIIYLYYSFYTNRCIDTKF